MLAVQSDTPRLGLLDTPHPDHTVGSGHPPPQSSRGRTSIGPPPGCHTATPPPGVHRLLGPALGGLLARPAQRFPALAAALPFLALHPWPRPPSTATGGGGAWLPAMGGEAWLGFGRHPERASTPKATPTLQHRMFVLLGKNTEHVRRDAFQHFTHNPTFWLQHTDMKPCGSFFPPPCTRPMLGFQLISMFPAAYSAPPNGTRERTCFEPPAILENPGRGRRPCCTCCLASSRLGWGCWALRVRISSSRSRPPLPITTVVCPPLPSYGTGHKPSSIWLTKKYFFCCRLF